MDHDNNEILDARLRERTGGERGFAAGVGGYLERIREAIGVLGTDVDEARSGQTEAGIELVLTRTPGILIGWTPYRGWYYHTADGSLYYRVGAESDAASAVPEVELVAAWLGVLATSGAEGRPEGHEDAPEALDPHDDALIERLATFGAGTDPYTPH